jgi:excinuclease UvrABC nuclease subunit
MAGKNRDLFRLIKEAGNGAILIGSADPILEAMSFELEAEVREQIDVIRSKSEGVIPELVSADHLVFDITGRKTFKFCQEADCHEQGRILETRPAFVYDSEQNEYEIANFGPEVSRILLNTRKKAIICEDDKMMAMVKGNLLDKYQTVPVRFSHTSARKVLPYKRPGVVKRGGQVIDLSEYTNRKK